MSNAALGAHSHPRARGPRADLHFPLPPGSPYSSDIYLTSIINLASIPVFFSILKFNPCPLIHGYIQLYMDIKHIIQLEHFLQWQRKAFPFRRWDGYQQDNSKASYNNTFKKCKKNELFLPLKLHSKQLCWKVSKYIRAVKQLSFFSICTKAWD